MPADPDAATTVHRCHAKECPAEVPAEVFMCPEHWSMVPAALRDSLKQTMPSGQEIDDAPSAEFLAFAKAAIAEVAHKRGAPAGSHTARPEGADATRPLLNYVPLQSFTLNRARICRPNTRAAGDGGRGLSREPADTTSRRGPRVRAPRALR